MSHHRTSPPLLLALLTVSGCGAQQQRAQPGDGTGGGTEAVLRYVEGEAPAESCPNGGRVVLVGWDADADGELDDEEVAATVYACHGADGEPGEAGLAGTDGAQGPPGQDGQDGQDGAQGPPGRDGQDGAQGPPGQDGQDGAQGPPGQDGAQGPPGQDGAQGPPGQDGAQGPPGQDGAQGPPGQDGAPCTLERDEAAGTTTITCPGSEPVVLRDPEGPVRVTVDYGLEYALDPVRLAERPEDAQLRIDPPGGGTPAMALALSEGETSRLVGTPLRLVAAEDALRAGFEPGQPAALEPVEEERGPVVVLIRTREGRIYKLGLGAAEGDVRYGLACEPLVRTVPAARIEYGRAFDLETGRAADLPGEEDFDLSPPWDGPNGTEPARLRPAPGVEVARLAPARYGTVGAEDVLTARFEEAMEHTLGLAEGETGPLVLLVRTATGRVYELDAGRPLSRDAWGLDYERLPFVPPDAIVRYHEPFDLDRGRSAQPDGEPHFSVHPGFGGMPPILVPEPGVFVARVHPGHFGLLAPEDLARTSLEEGGMGVLLGPIAQEDEQGPVVAVVRTPAGRLYEVGNARAVGQETLAFDFAPLRLGLPRIEIPYGRHFDLERGRVDPAEPGSADIAFGAADGGWAGVVWPPEDAELARLEPAFFDTVGRDDAQAAQFVRFEVPWSPIDQELGPVVILVRTRDGNLYKIAAGRQVWAGVHGFDYAELP